MCVQERTLGAWGLAAESAARGSDVAPRLPARGAPAAVESSRSVGTTTGGTVATRRRCRRARGAVRFHSAAQSSAGWAAFRFHPPGDCPAPPSPTVNSLGAGLGGVHTAVAGWVPIPWCTRFKSSGSPLPAGLALHVCSLASPISPFCARVPSTRAASRTDSKSYIDPLGANMPHPSGHKLATAASWERSPRTPPRTAAVSLRPKRGQEDPPSRAAPKHAHRNL